MFELRSNFSYCGHLDYPVVSNHTLLFNQAITLFNKARWNRLVAIIKAALLRRGTGLLDLAVFPQSRIINQHYSGIRPVSLDQIIGTLGRVGDFDDHFYPRTDRIRDSWISVAMARNQCIPLEPVKLIQVEDSYFVADGHHRISVAQALGETVIDAEITIWKVSGPLPWEIPPASAAHPVLSLFMR
jgi:hypothetical protein